MAKEQYRRRHSPSRGVLLKQWSLLVIIFILGYLTASIYQFSTLKNEFIGYFFEKQPLSVIHAKQRPVLPPPKFEFYTLLANEKKAQPARTTTAALEKTSTASATPTTQPAAVVPVHAEAIVPATKETYLVQVASFRRLNEAERLKAALLLKGINVNIHAAVQQGVQWYRVVMGPFASRQQAQQAQQFFSKREHTLGMIRRMDA